MTTRYEGERLPTSFSEVPSEKEVREAAGVEQKITSHTDVELEEIGKELVTEAYNFLLENKVFVDVGFINQDFCWSKLANILDRCALLVGGQVPGTAGFDDRDILASAFACFAHGIDPNGEVAMPPMTVSSLVFQTYALWVLRKKAIDDLLDTYYLAEKFFEEETEDLCSRVQL